MKYERIKLLQHPLTQALISHKWKAYAMPYSVLILALYLAFLVFLTAFSTVMPFPEGSQCKPPANTTISCEGILPSIISYTMLQSVIPVCIF